MYDLVDNYADAWKGNNKEAILEFDYNKDSGPNHTFDQYYVPQCDGYYKRQNKMFHFHKTFCSKFSFINTKQNVHFIPFEYALNEIKASNTANS